MSSVDDDEEDAEQDTLTIFQGRDPSRRHGGIPLVRVRMTKRPALSYVAREGKRYELARRREKSEIECPSCGLKVLNLGPHRRSLLCHARTKTQELVTSGFVVWTERTKTERSWQILHAAGLLRFEATKYTKGWGAKKHAKLEVERWTPAWAATLLQDLRNLRLPRADIELLIRAARDDYSRPLIVDDPETALSMLKGIRGR